jgi:hypothetical protein
VDVRAVVNLFIHTRAHAQEREREKKVKCHQCFLQSEKKNLKKSRKASFKVRKDEGKKEGKLIPSSSSVLNERRKERENASNELFPLSRVRAFLFLSREFFFRRSRERGEKNIIIIIAMRKISHSRRDENENENVPKA